MPPDCADGYVDWERHPRHHEQYGSGHDRRGHQGEGRQQETGRSLVRLDARVDEDRLRRFRHSWWVKRLAVAFFPGGLERTQWEDCSRRARVDTGMVLGNA